jgi:hypothetical protein
MKVGSDPGNGTIVVQEGNTNNWTENNLSNSNKPTSIGQIGSLNGTYSSNGVYTWSLSNFIFNQNEVSLLMLHTSGNDVAFKSDENSDAAGRPKLIITYENNAAQRSLTANAGDSGNRSVVYPNPTGGILNIRGITPESTIRIMDSSGRILIEETGKKQLDVSKLAAGMYFIKIDGELQKFIRQ